jgi:hypothetical protein
MVHGSPWILLYKSSRESPATSSQSRESPAIGAAHSFRIPFYPQKFPWMHSSHRNHHLAIKKDMLVTNPDKILCFFFAVNEQHFKNMKFHVLSLCLYGYTYDHICLYCYSNLN